MKRRVLPRRDDQGRIVDLEVLLPARQAAGQPGSGQSGSDHSGSIPSGASPRSLVMLGRGGPERELAVLSGFAPVSGQSGQKERTDGASSGQSGQPAARQGLPVLLGAGLGHALRALLERTDLPVAVVDKEEDILQASGLREAFPPESPLGARVCWITLPDARAALAALTHWQDRHGGQPLIPLANPFYLRLDRPWYQELRQKVEASARFDFWGQAVQPRFRSVEPRVLLMTSKYFLMGEVAAACKRLRLRHELLIVDDGEMGRSDFVERLLHLVLKFRPDCILTLNHLGLDREGVLIDLLERLQIPLASWFVDNPQLILHVYQRLVSPWTALFTWDRDNIPDLEAQGYPHVSYLPLGTNPRRFQPHPPAGRLPSPFFPCRLSFVGNSMVYKVEKKLNKNRFPAALLRSYRPLATAFIASPERSIRRFLLDSPQSADYQALPTDELRLEYEALITWEATRQYRAACVRAILPLKPVLIGDHGWKILFRQQSDLRLHPEVTYYDGLPRVYPFSDVNFNCTSQQMKGAVNQRIFDVPAAGAFVITELRDQLPDLMEPGREIAVYSSPEEAADRTAFYLDHPAERQRLVAAGRRRVLDQHCWEHRVRTLLQRMKEIYG